MSDTQNFVANALREFSSEIQEGLKKLNVDLNDIVNVAETIQTKSDLFVNVKSETQRNEYFKDKLNVVSPVVIPIGAEFHKTRRKGLSVTVKKFENVVYVPVDKVMEKLVNHPDYKNFVENKSSSTANSEILDSYMKGEKCKSNTVLRDHPDALRFILYYDDLEVCSPLKSKANKQKLGAFYILLDNMPLKYRSNLSNICLVALVNANLIKSSKYGMDCVLEIIMNDLKKFEDGVVLGGKTIFGTLIAVIGDNLGIHSLAGFKEGFTATHCCRYCVAILEQVRTMVEEDLVLMRDKDSHDQQCNEVQTAKGKNAKLSTRYGINRESVLNDLKSFHIIGGCPPDELHDCLEGWLPIAIKKLLYYHLFEKKNPLFTLDWLNAAIQDFDFDYSEESDRPSKIKKEHLESREATIHQSACQTWLLGIILPLIIGPLISTDDKHFKNYMDCLEICRIVFTIDIPKWMVSYLRDAIATYLTDYQKLFGDLIPKQHFLIHVPGLILQMGSLVNYLCLRCEAKHKYFKNIVNILCCYKNIPLSLSEKHQFQQAPDWLNKGLIKSNKCGPCKVMDSSEKKIISILPFSGNIIQTNWLNLGGILIVPNRCFICIGVEDFLPVFAKVVRVVIHPGLLFVCEKVQTKQRNVHLGAYKISVTKELCTHDPRDLISHIPYHSHMFTMKDLRNVERGECTKCPCGAYQLELGSTRSACSYCECPAPAHMEIVEAIDPAVPGVPSKTDVVYLELPSNAESLMDPNSKSTSDPNSDEIEKEFPERFPVKVQKALENRSLTFNHKSTIVRGIVDKLYEKKLDNNRCLAIAARKILYKYSPMKSPLDPNGKALLEKLRRRRDRLRVESGATKTSSSVNRTDPSVQSSPST
ncbi:hypothetical protein FOCC_FOCC012691 [Frankliniella occidentalis]|nr:hypothetical protein FOCC_FOCC012691 [Frankliniella occidentalis]